MQDILRSFNGNTAYTMDDLIAEAIENGHTDFLKWAYNNDLFVTTDYSDYITEYATYDTFKFIYELSEFNYDVDKLAELGDLESLEYIYEKDGHYPSVDGYNSARDNGRTDVVEWINKIAADKLYK